MLNRELIMFQILPRLPEKLQPLLDLAYNLEWTWDQETLALFMRMDLDLWDATRHNPVQILGQISQDRLETLSNDDSFLAHMERAQECARRYSTQKCWYETNFGTYDKPYIAYFSMEFGLSDCIPSYSGGLGVLAGDHLKSASDLGVPLVGVGLAYQQGYFRQYLNLDGWQQETYPDNDFYNMPMKLVLNDESSPVFISINLSGRTVYAAIWLLQIGRINLFLLDTNVPQNSPDDRQITHQLYGGDREMRIQQEILLGIGGIRALDALGMTPQVCHMNEGHSAFLALERIRKTMQDSGVTFDEALVATRAGNVFTTHTPVSAGIDMFDQKLIEKYFSNYIAELNITLKDLMKLGHAEGDSVRASLNMALLAIHTSTYVNGVSRLHGRVAREMWNYDWPDVPRNEVPITHITNGVHIHTWVSREMTQLMTRYLGMGWEREVSNPEAWTRIEDIPDAELWMTHERRKERLVAYARVRLVQQYQRRGLPQAEISRAREALLPSALTLGFARRFATYKRATLLLKDPARLVRLLTNENQPVQILFAGKAHPHDEEGKQLIRDLIHFSEEAGLTHRLVFLEDYDMNVARYLVQGVDVWVNTPRRPLEASGTSGMKAVVNGALNLSILDGWWDEAFGTDVGWAIGYGEEYDDSDLQDKIESDELYDILEREIVPCYYSRGSDMLPRDWIAMMKASMERLCPFFNTDRMVQDYTRKLYVPARMHYENLTRDQYARSRDMAQWCRRVTEKWKQISITRIDVQNGRKRYVGESLPVQVYVRLGELTCEDVSVELYVGQISPDYEIDRGTVIQMHCTGQTENGETLYEGEIPCNNSGRHGFAVRVLPRHEDLVDPHSLKLICWK